MKKFPNRFDALDAVSRPANSLHALPVSHDVHEIPVGSILTAGITEHMYMPGESIFASVAEKVHARGWTMLPQSRIGKRLPARIDGETLKWGEFQHRKPTLEEVRNWCLQGRSENGAVLLGPASGNVWALDIDVVEEKLSYSIQELARNILGETDFRRQGQAPKMALLYRAADEESLPPYRALKFMNAAGTEASGDALEILGAGRMITCYGYHHKTSEYFKWLGPQPFSHAPHEVPTATFAQLEEFFDAVQDLRTVYRHGLSGGGDGVWIEGQSNGVVIGKMSLTSTSVLWVQDDEGFVTDGRDEYLWSLTKQTVRRNGVAILQGAMKTEDIRTAIEKEFRRTEKQDKKAWATPDLRRAISDKSHRAIGMLTGGVIKPWTEKSRQSEPGVVDIAPVSVEEYPRVVPRTRIAEDTTFAWLNPRRSAIRIRETGPDAAKAVERRLNPDRAAVGAAAAAAVAVGVNAFLDDVVGRNNRIHSLKGPTGIGKTATVVLELVKRADLLKVETGPYARGPMVMLVATYNNIEELRHKAHVTGLDPYLSDDELEMAAAEMGLVKDDQLEITIEEFKRFASGSNLIVAVNKGKIRAGCLEREKVLPLQKAGIPTSQMCRSEVRERDSQGRPTGESVEVFCPHYSYCPAIQQRKEIAKSHLTLMVRSFLTLSLPEEVLEPKGVVMDERIFDQLIKTTTFPLDTLRLPRRKPALAKRERDDKMDAVELLQSRDQAAAMAMQWMKEGKDLAAEFRGWSKKVDNKKTITGFSLVADARRVCGNAMTSQAELHPDLTIQQILDICAKPQGTDIAKEFRFWALIEDGITQNLTHELAGRKHIARDGRIQLLDFDPADPDCKPSIRVSWKVEGNWIGTPTLLLDASTDEVLIDRVMGGGREIVPHNVEVSLNQRVAVAIDRRLSTTGLFPKKTADIHEHAKAAQTLADMRLIIATFAATHAHGRVLVVPTKKLRRLIQKGWTKPNNVDFGHHGAMAGLDYAKGHVGVLTLGRIEMPIREIDGIVAALQHGRAEQERLIDSTGTGADQDGGRVTPNSVKRILKHRDGSDIEYSCQEHAGDLARRVQRQYREENLRQDIGRGRPVYRTTPLSVVMVAESIPDDIIIDEIIGFEDLSTKSGWRLWEAARLSNGIIEPAILALHAPHLGDVARFEKEMAEWFFRVPTTVSRYHEILVKRSDGQLHTAYVPSHSPTWKSDLAAVLLDMEWTGTYDVVRRSAVSEPAVGTAPIDDIEQYLAGDNQHDIEVAALKALITTAQVRGVWRKLPIGFNRPGVAPTMIPLDYVLRDGEYARKALRMDVWMMLDQMKDTWALTGDEVVVETTPAAVGDHDIPDVA